MTSASRPSAGTSRLPQGRRRGRAAAAAVAAAAALAAPLVAAPAAHAATPHTPGHAGPVAVGGAVFVQSDDTTANTVAAYHRAPDGSLHAVGVYRTGGRGGQLPGSMVDHLASEGSLTYDPQGRLLYAVNAGSDTLTVFAVAGDRLIRTQTLSTSGEFPVSVAVRHDRVYVLNALGGSSVQGYLRTGGGRLEPVRGWHRDLDLGTDASSAFTATPAQVGFTPDGNQLVVTTKGATNAIDVLPVGGGDAAPGNNDGPGRPVVNSLPGAVPFGFAFDAAGRLAVTLAGPNAVATFAVHADGHVTQLDQAATEQTATCWITAVPGRPASPGGTLLFASNAGSGSVSGFHSHGWYGHLAPTDASPTATGPGTVDSAATPDGRYLYVQTGGTGTVDGFRVGPDGTLTPVDTTLVPGAVGGEGIATT